jgi:hypothetical protein
MAFSALFLKLPVFFNSTVEVPIEEKCDQNEKEKAGKERALRE